MSRDTSLAMREKYEAMLMASSPERRLAMAASMFASCRKIQLAQIRAEGIPEAQWPIELFRRTYTDDFTPEKLASIIHRISNP